MTSRKPELQQTVSNGSIRPDITTQSEIQHPEWCDEAVPAVTRTIPVCPSQVERDLHELTHLPFRSWCTHCVALRNLRSTERERPLL